MDLSCIISSGDLELYVLGLLPQDEAYKIEQLALLFPEVKAELDSISQSLEALAAHAEATPSPAVKNRLMEQLKTLKAEEDNIQHTNTAPPVQPTSKSATAPVVQMNTRKKTKMPLLAASVIGLLLCLGALIYLLGQNKQNSEQVASLQQQVGALQKETTEQQQQLQAYNQELQLWQSNEVRKINLTNVPGKPEALAQVFWNEKTNEVFISNVSLPPAPAGKQYQLWAIVNGQPVDAGLLNSEPNRVQKMKAFEAADAFAITLENTGGSTTPTLTEMYVLAQVS